jgi:hypothetical protein
MTNATYAAKYVAARLKPTTREKKTSGSVWVWVAIITILLLTK